MNADPVGTAYNNFVEVFHPHKSGMGHQFWKFLKFEKPPQGLMGSEPNAEGVWHGWKGFNEEQKRIVELMNSPHYRTVCKILHLKGHDPFTSIYHNES